jgi:ELWxxDGT repeat protein
VVGSQLLFIAPTPNAGTVLWKSDGTQAGTQPIRILQAGQNNYATINDSRVAGGLLFFSTLQQLWVSNGTAAGTRALTPFFGTPPALSQESLFKGRYYFEARTESYGWEIWSTDGTRAGTRMLADLCRRDCSGVFPGSLRTVGNRLLFTVHSSTGGVKLWQSDGTAQGTRMIQASRDYQRTGDGPVHVAAGRVLFTANYPPTAPPQLWRTDGTKTGTFRITDFIGIGVSNELLGEIPGALLFRIVNESGLDQLWVSNGTRPGTRLLKTIRAGD